MHRIRYAVVGVGHIAQVAVLPAFAHAENCELAALVTGDAEVRRKLSARYEVPAFSYDRLEECFEEQRVDAVYIALPNSLHREYTERAAAAGVHVLCEKPMAANETDCMAMIRACADAGVKLMIAYRLHFTDAHVRAIDLAKRGTLGELRIFNSVFAMQVAEGNVRLSRSEGGGTLWDIGIYCVNAARYLFQDEPVKVLGVTTSGDDKRFTEVEEMASATLRFPRGRIATFTSSFGSSDMDQLELIGTKGSLRMAPAYPYTEDLTWTLKLGDETKTQTFAAGDQFAPELIYFANCILHDSPPEPSGEEGLADVRIIQTLYDSALKGCVIPVEPIRISKRPDGSQEIKRPPVDAPEPVRSEAPSRD